jgi:hypothetical protein
MVDPRAVGKIDEMFGTKPDATAGRLFASSVLSGDDWVGPCCCDRGQKPNGGPRGGGEGPKTAPARPLGCTTVLDLSGGFAVFGAIWGLHCTLAGAWPHLPFWSLLGSIGPSRIRNPRISISVTATATLWLVADVAQG